MLDLRHIEFRPALADLSAFDHRDKSLPRWSPPSSGWPEPRNHLQSESWALVAEVLCSFGIDPLPYRESVLERRVPALLRRLRVSTPTAARELLRRSPDLRSAALDTLLIGVTEFFRDAAVFSYLRARALPDLLAARPNLRVLSVGASDGSELYSVAMLLAEAGALGRCELVGIDCRPEAVARARAAEFRPEAMAPLCPERSGRFFFTCGSQGLLRPEIAAPLRFQVADLFSYSTPAPWDIILCRNVVMYFVRSAAARAWRHLADQLSSGGLLITGKAEQPMDGLDFLRLAPCVYRKSAAKEPVNRGFRA